MFYERKKQIDLDRVIRDGFSEKVAFKLRPEKSERASQGRGGECLSQRNSMCEGVA